MDIRELQANWDAYGSTDPLWAVLTYAGKMGNRWDREELFATGKADVESVLKEIAEHGFTVRFDKALDFGCAVGRLTQSLAEHFRHVVGVDIAPSMIALANQFNQHGDRVEYVLNEQDDLRFLPDNDCDFILTLITLQHMAPRYAKNYLREFLRVLTPGGLLVFQIPSEMEAGYKRKQALKRLLPEWLIQRYHKARHSPVADTDSGQPPTMEMYGIPREEMVSFLEAQGGKVLYTEPDYHAGNWHSFRYLVTKP